METRLFVVLLLLCIVSFVAGLVKSSLEITKERRSHLQAVKSGKRWKMTLSGSKEWEKRAATFAIASGLLLPSVTLTMPIGAFAKTELPSLEKIFNAVRIEISPEGMRFEAIEVCHF